MDRTPGKPYLRDWAVLKYGWLIVVLVHVVFLGLGVQQIRSALEMFDPDGTINPDGKIPGADRVEARQFLMYVVRPLSRPRGWWVGASYRSEGITKLFAGANLGQNGVVGLAVNLTNAALCLPGY